MRNIKFRAWNSNINAMVKDISKDPYCPIEHYLDENYGFKVMQFTGLHDKNGKEIWEGDIGRLSCHENCVGAIGEVGWWNDGWWIMTNKNHEGYSGEYKLRTSEVVQSIDKTGEYSKFEVLGNIYENRGP